MRSIGASAGVITTSTGIGQARQGSEIITVIGTDGSVLEEKSVPQKWLNHEENAKNKHRRLKRKLDKNPIVHNVSLGTRDKEIRGKRISELIVYSESPSDLKNKIGTSIGGIQISHREYTGPVQLDSCTNECGRDEYDPVPGGVLLHRASAACRVKNQNGDERLLTAAHVVLTDGGPDGDCNEWIDPVTQGEADQVVGKVDEVSPDEDWATVYNHSSSDLDYGYSSEIFEQGSYNRDVEGHVTESGVYDLKSSGKEIRHSGTKSCETSGPLVEMYNSGGLRCTSINGHNYIKADLCTEGGDSGGVYYDTRYSSILGDYHAVIAVHHGGESKGYAAYDIHQSAGYTFG